MVAMLAFGFQASGGDPVAGKISRKFDLPDAAQVAS